MQSNANIKQLLTSNYIVSPKIRVLAEWNMNRYFQGTATNDGESAAGTANAASHKYPIYYPISSICNPFRWNKGIAYPVLNSSYFLQPGGGGGSVPQVKLYSYPQMSESQRQSLPSRYYLAGAGNVYKYWISPQPSSFTGGIPDCTPTVTYDQAISANKITVKFNNHAVNPIFWTIAAEINGSWSTLVSNVHVPTNGVVEIYRHRAGGGWSTTPEYWTEDNDNIITLTAVKVHVTTVDARLGGQVEVIEISPRIHADFTELTNDYSIQNEAADANMIAPIGDASANSGTINLSNDSGLFDNGNTESPFYQLIDEGVYFTIDIIYNDNGSSADVVRQATMISDTGWAVSGWDTATVPLLDYAKIFQGVKCPDMLLNGYRATNIIWRLMDAVGFPNVVVHEDALALSDVVEHFWCGTEDTVWDVLQNVAKSNQLACFFDEYGVMQVMTRDYLYSESRAINWQFKSDSDIDGLSDIISFDRSETLNFNKVTVKYKATNDFDISGSRQQIFWQAPDDWSIGAANLVANVPAGQSWFNISTTTPQAAPGTIDGARQLPFWTGQVDIVGNVLDYIGKGYYVAGVERMLASDADWAQAVEDNNGQPPTFTGKIFLKKPCPVSINDITFTISSTYRIYSHVDGLNPVVSTKSVVHDQTMTSVKISDPSLSYASHIHMMRDWGRSYDRIGAKFMLDSTTGGFGLTLFNGGTTNMQAYYFTVYNFDDPTMAGQQTTVRAWRYNTLQAATGLSNYTSIRPPRLVTGQWHYMEVVYAKIPGGLAFNLYFDGVFVGKFHDTNVAQLAPNTRGGVYTIGPTTAHVDKIYVVDYPADARKIPQALKDYYPDDAWYWAAHRQARDSKISRGDFAFAQYQAVVQRYGAAMVLDDFNAYQYNCAREIMTETVRFDKFPARNAQILKTNDSVAVLSFDYSPMGATFVLKNNTTSIQQLRGTWETPVSGASNDETFAIYGDTVFQMDTQSVENEDTGLINRRGESAIEFEFDWIQTRVAAQRLADWVKKRFGAGTETYTMEVFGNPLLQIGDIVTVNYADKGFTPTNFRGVITTINNSWAAGLTTKVTVRKIVNIRTRTPESGPLGGLAG